MDFEQELQELISAALEAGISRDAIASVLGEAGISRDAIASVLGERAATLTHQDLLEDEDEDDDQP